MMRRALIVAWAVVWFGAGLWSQEPHPAKSHVRQQVATNSDFLRTEIAAIVKAAKDCDKAFYDELRGQKQSGRLEVAGADPGTAPLGCGYKTAIPF